MSCVLYSSFSTILQKQGPTLCQVFVVQKERKILSTMYLFTYKMFS